METISVLRAVSCLLLLAAASCIDLTFGRVILCYFGLQYALHCLFHGSSGLIMAVSWIVTYSLHCTVSSICAALSVSWLIRSDHGSIVYRYIQSWIVMYSTHCTVSSICAALSVPWLIRSDHGSIVDRYVEVPVEKVIEKITEVCEPDCT